MNNTKFYKERIEFYLEDLKENGFDYKLQRRNEHYAIDEYKADGTCLNAVFSGLTLKEAYIAIRAFWWMMPF